VARTDLRSRAADVFRRAASEGVLERVTEELGAFGRLLRVQPRLRATLSDVTVPAEAKSGFLRGLLGDRLHPRTLEVLDVAVERAAGRLRAVVDDLVIESVLAAAEASDRLGAVESELVGVVGIVSEQSSLRQAITDPILPDERKVALVEDLLRDRAAPETVALVAHVVRIPGDPVEVLQRLIERAAERRGRVVAQARSAVPLTEEQERRLAAALSRATGREVDLEVVVDPAVMGGVVARVGDEIIDGTVRTQLRVALERLTS
jgi:F-type H+-transporting ATPase subunit delta